MPITVNIPPVVRFVLYVIGSLGSLVVIYAIQKGWAGDAEQQLWTGFAGLLTLLAASKTPVRTSEEDGHVNWAAIAAIATVVLVLIVLFGWRA